MAFAKCFFDQFCTNFKTHFTPATQPMFPAYVYALVRARMRFVVILVRRRSFAGRMLTEVLFVLV